MSVRRGKRIAFAAGLIAIAVLAAAALTFRNRILEEWYLRKLDSKDLETRKTAALRLGEIGSARAVRPLLELWSRHHGEIRLILPPGGQRFERDENPIYALDAVVSMGDRAIPGLIRALEDPDARIRVTASEAIAQMGPFAQGTQLSLQRGLQDPEEDVRREALLALDSMDRATVELLSTLLEDPSPRVRLCASNLLLNKKGAEADQAIPLLVKACSGGDENLSLSLIQGFKDTPEMHRLFRALLPRAIAHHTFNVRAVAARMALDVGPSTIGPEAISALFSMLASEVPGEDGPAYPALSALRRIETEAALAELEAGKGDLAGLDPAAIPGMIKGLSLETEPEIQRASMIALGLQGPKAREALPILLDKLKWHDNDELAAAALVRIADLPLLLETISDPKVSEKSVGLIFSQLREEFIPELPHAYHEAEKRKKLSIVRVIPYMGPEARAALVPELIRGLEDPKLRSPITSALELIGRESTDDPLKAAISAALAGIARQE